MSKDNNKELVNETLASVNVDETIDVSRISQLAGLSNRGTIAGEKVEEIAVTELQQVDEAPYPDENERLIDSYMSRSFKNLDQLRSFFKEGGRLEQAIDAVGGDKAYMNDVRAKWDDLWDAIEEAHYGALGHKSQED
jgi:hypothetical protein